MNIKVLGMIKLSIAENIKKLREYYNISQKELAQIAGVTDKAISTWETGTYEPRIGAIQKIAEHFNIKKSDLIEDLGWKNFHGLKNNDSTEAITERVKNLSKENKEKALEYINLLNMLEDKQTIEKENLVDFKKEA